MPEQTATMTEQHEPENWYWDADSDDCPHDPRPDDDMSDAWDEWMDRHQAYDGGMLCLDAPAGEACAECSAEHGEMVPWTQCDARTHRRPCRGITPGPDVDHEQIPIWVGTTECLDRECDGYFTEDGDEIPGLERCSHIREESACSCQLQEDGEYNDEPCPLNVPSA